MINESPRKATQRAGNGPSSPESEKGLLCSAMLQTNPVLSLCVAAGITAAHFVEYRHQQIYNAILACWSECKDGAHADLTVVTPKLRDMGELDKAGGGAYIAELYTFTPTAANTRAYIADLAEKFSLRNTLATLREGMNKCTAPDANSIEIIGEVTSALAEVAAKKEIKSCTEDAFAEVERMIEERSNGNEFSPPLGMPTGNPAWDKVLKGLFPGEMYVLVSAPGGGKTSAVEQAIELQIETGSHVLVIQKDMSIPTMIGRMAARRAHTSYSRFKTGHATAGALVAIKEAVSELKSFSSRLHIFNPDGLTPEQLDTLVRAEKQRHDIKAFYLDHFFQLKFPGRANLPEKSMEASISIRRTITETAVAGVILVHMTREAQKANRDPTASDVKWCDQLYCDCDAMVILNSTQTVDELKPGELREITAHIVKNRTGPESKELMHFDRERARFVAI